MRRRWPAAAPVASAYAPGALGGGADRMASPFSGCLTLGRGRGAIILPICDARMPDGRARVADGRHIKGYGPPSGSVPRAALPGLLDLDRQVAAVGQPRAVAPRRAHRVRPRLRVLVLQL